MNALLKNDLITAATSAGSVSADVSAFRHYIECALGELRDLKADLAGPYAPGERDKRIVKQADLLGFTGLLRTILEAATWADEEMHRYDTPLNPEPRFTRYDEATGEHYEAAQ